MGAAYLALNVTFRSRICAENGDLTKATRENLPCQSCRQLMRDSHTRLENSDRSEGRERQIIDRSNRSNSLGNFRYRKCPRWHAYRQWLASFMARQVFAGRSNCGEFGTLQLRFNGENMASIGVPSNGSVRREYGP